jgi:hypothetical protein
MLPPPTISGIGGSPHMRGLVSAFQQQPSDEGLMNNLGLQNRAQQGALDFYNKQNTEDFGNPLAQAVHMGQAAQATQGADPQGLHSFNQALAERQAAITPHSGFQGTDTPQSTFDPSFQTSAVDPTSAPIKALKRFR